MEGRVLVYRLNLPFNRCVDSLPSFLLILPSHHSFAQQAFQRRKERAALKQSSVAMECNGGQSAVKKPLTPFKPSILSSSKLGFPTSAVKTKLARSSDNEEEPKEDERLMMTVEPPPSFSSSASSSEENFIPMGAKPKDERKADVVKMSSDATPSLTAQIVKRLHLRFSFGGGVILRHPSEISAPTSLSSPFQQQPHREDDENENRVEGELSGLERRIKVDTVMASCAQLAEQAVASYLEHQVRLLYLLRLLLPL